MLAGTVTRMLARYGAVWTLQHRVSAAGANAWTAGSVAQTFITCRAYGREIKQDEIGGGLQQGDWLVFINPATLSQTPAEHDRIALGSFITEGSNDWLQIVDVKALTEAGVLRYWKIQARR